MTRLILTAAVLFCTLALSSAAEATCRQGLQERNVYGTVVHQGGRWGVRPPRECYNGVRGTPPESWMMARGAGARARLICCVLPSRGSGSSSTGSSSSSRSTSSKGASSGK